MSAKVIDLAERRAAHEERELKKAAAWAIRTTQDFVDRIASCPHSATKSYRDGEYQVIACADCNLVLGAVGA